MLHIVVSLMIVVYDRSMFIVQPISFSLWAQLKIYRKDKDLCTSQAKLTKLRVAQNCNKSLISSNYVLAKLAFASTFFELIADLLQFCATNNLVAIRRQSL